MSFDIEQSVKLAILQIATEAGKRSLRAKENLAQIGLAALKVSAAALGPMGKEEFLALAEKCFDHVADEMAEVRAMPWQ